MQWLSFFLFCPTNPNLIDNPMFMFDNGSLHKSLNFKDICPIEEKAKKANIAFDQMRNGLYVHRKSEGKLDQMEMEYFSKSNALENSGKLTKIPWDWKILKLFFTSFNISPVWIEISRTEIRKCGDQECVSNLVYLTNLS